MGAMAAAGLFGAEAAATAGEAFAAAAPEIAAAGLGAADLAAGAAGAVAPAAADITGGAAGDLFAAGGAGAFTPTAAETAAAFGAPEVAGGIAGAVPSTAGEIAAGTFSGVPFGGADVLSAGAGSGAAQALGSLQNIFGGAQQALSQGVPQLPVTPATVAPTAPVTAGGAGAAGAGASAPAGGAASLAAPPSIAVDPANAGFASSLDLPTGAAPAPLYTPDTFAGSAYANAAAPQGSVVPLGDQGLTTVGASGGPDLSGLGRGIGTLADTAQGVSGGGAGVLSSPGTVGYVDPAYGSFVPPAPSAPGADVFAAETAPAPQLTQLSPGGILEPGTAIPGYGPGSAGQFDVAFGGGGVTPPSYAANAVSPGIGDVVRAEQFAGDTYGGVDNLAAVEGTPVGGGPTSVATTAVGPDTAPLMPGDTNVLEATRGYTEAPVAPTVTPRTLMPAPTAGADSGYGAGLAYAGGAAETEPATAGVAEAGGGASAVPTAAATSPSVVGGGAVSNGGIPGVTYGSSTSGTFDPSAIAGGASRSAAPWWKPFTSPASILAGGGLALDAAKSLGLGGNPPGYNQINTLAGNAAQNSQQLESYLQSGTLPPGMQAAANQASADAEATIKSRYASMGMSGSSAEAQDIQNMRTRMAGQTSDLARQLFATGANEAQMSGQLYQYLMNYQVQQDQALSQGITNMVTALAGLSRPLVAAAA